jgi:DNA uptake protein ComE-like DNA-binding protein
LLALLAPVAASAQFTTFVAPPRKAVDSAKQAIVAERRAQSDSATRMTLTNMKAWVDSAAGVGIPASAADTAAAAVQTPAGQTPPATSTTTFSNGVVAPDTASQLPLILLVGVGAFSAGLLLLTASRRSLLTARSKKIGGKS